MPDNTSSEIIKKVVGRKKPADVWDRLDQLNKFASKLKQPGTTDDGHPVRKTVGKPRPGSG